MTFRTPEEAIERANNTPYGLSAGVWTDKGSKIFKIVNKLRAGVVWANTYNKFDPPARSAATRKAALGAKADGTACCRISRSVKAPRLSVGHIEVKQDKSNAEERAQDRLEQSETEPGQIKTG